MCAEKWVTPGCCAAAKARVAVHLAFSDYDFTKAPSWVLRVRPLDLQREPEPPMFCPFCGKALPAIEKDPSPPSLLCVITDGGYYCDTCKERLMVCQCDPPEFAWRVKP